MVIVIWGVSGCGKTTIGRTLAALLGWKFLDADDFHPQANIDKMRDGVPLTDDDRYPWLARLAGIIADTNVAGENAVLACSALKRAYRDRLGIDEGQVKSVHLAGSEALIQTRLEARSHQFMASSLLASQFAALSPETDGLVVDIRDSPETICEQIIKTCSLAHSTAASKNDLRKQAAPGRDVP